MCRVAERERERLFRQRHGVSGDDVKACGAARAADACRRCRKAAAASLSVAATAAAIAAAAVATTTARRGQRRKQAVYCFHLRRGTEEHRHGTVSTDFGTLERWRGEGETGEREKRESIAKKELKKRRRRFFFVSVRAQCLSRSFSPCCTANARFPSRQCWRRHCAESNGAKGRARLRDKAHALSVREKTVIE